MQQWSSSEPVRSAPTLRWSLTPEVRYEDDDVIVVEKPAGLVCQDVREGHEDDLPGVLRRALAQRRGRQQAQVYLGTHQRLDQETSGVLLYTLSESANAPIAQQFEARRVEKIYLAAVSGRPPEPGSLLVDELEPAGGGRMRVQGRPGPRTKRARTRVLDVRSAHGRSLLTLSIETGRTHQVRVQLAARGCPVAGDALYGGERAARLGLHAHSIRFAHPRDGRPIEVDSPLPLELADWLTYGHRPAFEDPGLLSAALRRAQFRRCALLRAHALGQTTAFRLLNDDADGIPGCAVDVYDRFVVLRMDGDDRHDHEQALLRALEPLAAAGIYCKRHPKQANELVDPRTERLAPRRPSQGRAAPDRLTVFEHGVPYEVRLHEGLRTGLFLDQRDNRERVRQLARGKRVLNLFGYTGSLSVAALVGGATSVVTVDFSRTALAWAERNVAGVGGSARHRSLAEDAFLALAAFARRGERFDLVIVDPPSYSTSKRGRFRVTKDYVSLCAAALEVVDDSGLLLACLNHRGVSRAALEGFVEAAAQRATRDLHALKQLPSGRDFPSPPGADPDMKSVLVTVSNRNGLRSPSARLGKRKRR